MVLIKPIMHVQKEIITTLKKCRVRPPACSDFNSLTNDFYNLASEPNIKQISCYSLSRIKNIISSYYEKFLTKYIKKSYAKTEISDEVKKISENLNIKEIAVEKNFLGSGANGRVYKIPNTKYAIKIPSDSKTSTLDCENAYRIARDKVNFIEANFGQIKVLNLIDGIPVRQVSFNPNSLNSETITKLSNSINNLSDNSIKKYYLQLLEAKRLNMGHDFIGNNCLLNVEKNIITAIDFDLGRKTYFLESLIFQCGDSKLLSVAEQNKLFKKGLRNLLELIQEGKILPQEVILDGKTLLENAKVCNFEIKDEKYFNYLCQLCDDFSRNKSFENVVKILSKI